MRVLITAPLALSFVAGCLTDPPYRPYATQPSQSGYGPQSGPPPNQASPGQYAGPSPSSSSGPSNYPTYQTNLGGPGSPGPQGAGPSGPQPPPFVEPAPGASGGVTVTSTNAPPPMQPGPLPPAQGPAGAPPASTLPATVAGRYVCWVSGAGMYAQSSLGTLTLDFNSTYSSTANTATGTYRVDGTRVLFTGGPIAGYVGSLETNRNGPLVRFRVDHPNDPGPALGVGDHVCYLAR
jgi:hypothetical protein